MRQVALEVHLILLTIAGMMQEGVGIVENAPFADGVIAVVCAEFCKCPIGDILLAVCAVLVVGVEGEGLIPGLCVYS